MSHGKASERGSLVVYRHHAAGVCGVGDGVLGVGGDGQGQVWFAVCVSVATAVVGGSGTGGDGSGDAPGLPPLQKSGGSFFSDGIDHVTPDFCLLSGSLAQYPPLDPLGWFLAATFRVGQAGTDSVSCLFSRRPYQEHGRLAQHVASGRRARTGFSGTYCLAARFGYGHRLFGNNSVHSFCGRDAHEVFRLCIRSSAAAAVLPDFSRELAARPYFGVSESVRGPARDGISYYSVPDCRGYRRGDRNGVDGGQTEVVLSAGAAH